MYCSILSNLYVRSNGDIACYDDRGEQIILGRVQTNSKGWSIENIFNSPIYTHIRRSLASGTAPWDNICQECALFRPNLPHSETISLRAINILQVEPSLACNLKCPCCSQQFQILDRPAPFRMPVELYQQLLSGLRDQGYSVREVEYCGQGEPLIHQNFRDFVQFTKDLFPTTRQRVVTNGNFDFARTIADSPIDQVFVSCDGIRQTSYEQYRVGGKVSRVKAFMADACLSRVSYRKRVIWKYILFEFNDSDDELVEAQRFAEEVGVDELMFVFTHSLYKSVRLTALNAHEIPRVWSRLTLQGTPLLSQDMVHWSADSTVKWPTTDLTTGSTMMLDTVSQNSTGLLHLDGWALASEQYTAIYIYHNNKLAGLAEIGIPRPDVFSAYPEFDVFESGFRLNWLPNESSGKNTICVELRRADGSIIARFERRYTAAIIPRLVPRFVSVRPNGATWSRSFTTEAAAWRAIVGGTNDVREAQMRRAQLKQAGWTVRLAT